MTESPDAHARVVLNGKSSQDEDIREAVSRLRNEGHKVSVRVTWEDGDAERIVERSPDDGVTRIIAAGGDGTINGVVNGLMRIEERARRPAFGMVPMGTANDFAVGCCVPLDDRYEALRLAVTGEARTADVGKINDEHFVNVAASGLGAKVTAETPPVLKKVLGGTAYALMGLVRVGELEPFAVELEVGGLKNEFEILALTVANGRNTGHGKVVAPEAKIDDGLLDVLVVHATGPENWAQVLDEYDSIGDEHCQYVRYHQLEAFRMNFREDTHLNLDGEPRQEKSFDVCLVPGAIELVVGPDCQLFTEDLSSEVAPVARTARADAPGRT